MILQRLGLRSRHVGWLGAAAAAMLLLSAANVGAQRHVSADFDHAGEQGLTVAERDGRLDVGWITRRPGPGFLRVVQDGRLLREVRTRSGASHAARVRVDSRDVTLQYGSATDAGDRHETVVRLGDAPAAEPQRGAVDSLFVVGDVHGEHDRLLQLLQNAGVVDAAGRWGGGRAHLVLLGDLMDRGPDVTRVLWLVYRLEREAEAAGGRVHVVLGNHEIMVFTGDERYVHPKELKLAELHGFSYAQLFDIRSTVIGRWLTSKPAMLRIGDVLFAHGGVTRDQLPYSVLSLNDTLRSFMSEELFYRWSDESFPVALDSAGLARRNDFFWSDRSLFWHRGYVQSDTMAVELGEVLAGFESSLQIVAHTPVPNIQPRYGGALVAVHPRFPATEMLLLTREQGVRKAWRYSLVGPPEPL